MEMPSLFSFALMLLSVAVGYVLRKYVEKTWPNEAALLDTVATRYGQQAEKALADAMAKARAS